MDHVQLGPVLADPQLIENFFNEICDFKAWICDEGQVIAIVGEVLDKGAAQQGLSSSDFPCQHDRPFPRLHAIQKPMQSFLVPGRRKVEERIRNVIEGSFFQPPVIFVVQCSPFWNDAYSYILASNRCHVNKNIIIMKSYAILPCT